MTFVTICSLFHFFTYSEPPPPQLSSPQQFTILTLLFNHTHNHSHHHILPSLSKTSTFSHSPPKSTSPLSSPLTSTPVFHHIFMFSLYQTYHYCHHSHDHYHLPPIHQLPYQMSPPSLPPPSLGQDFTISYPKQAPILSFITAITLLCIKL